MDTTTKEQFAWLCSWVVCALAAMFPEKISIPRTGTGHQDNKRGQHFTPLQQDRRKWPPECTRGDSD